MSKAKLATIEVQGSVISVLSMKEEDYISLTDMTRKFGDDTLIYSWMRNRNTLEFLGIWEQIHNPDFKGGEFETFKKEAGLNSFHLTPRKWVEGMNAEFIHMGLPQSDRLKRLNEIAIRQLQTLTAGSLRSLGHVQEDTP